MKALGFIFAITFSPLVWSGEIVSTKNIEILAVNGSETTGGFFSNDKIEVEDGSHQVVVKFIDSFGNNDLIQSRPYIFSIEVKGKTTLKTDRLNSKSHALSKIDNGLIWYVSNDGGEYTVKETTQLKGKGFMPYSDIEGLIAEYNQTNNNPTAAVTVAVVADNTNTPPTINMIIEQYKVATKEQKKEFKIWLIDNETN